MKTELLNPQNSAVIFIDFQPQMVFGVANVDRQTLFNNVLLLAKSAKIFKVPSLWPGCRVCLYHGAWRTAEQERRWALGSVVPD